MSAFSDRLRDMRVKRKLSQSELGKKVGLHYTQIGRYERGTSKPSSDVLAKLASELEVSTDFLMEGTTEESARSRLHDRELLRYFKQVEELDEQDKRVVKTLIDAFLTKRKLQRLAE